VRHFKTSYSPVAFGRACISRFRDASPLLLVSPFGPVTDQRRTVVLCNDLAPLRLRPCATGQSIRRARCRSRDKRRHVPSIHLLLLISGLRTTYSCAFSLSDCASDIALLIFEIALSPVAFVLGAGDTVVCVPNMQYYVHSFDKPYNIFMARIPTLGAKFQHYLVSKGPTDESQWSHDTA
jgi:hypothetical protein